MRLQLVKARKEAVDTHALLEASRRDHLEATMKQGGNGDSAMIGGADWRSCGRCSRGA